MVDPLDVLRQVPALAELRTEALTDLATETVPVEVPPGHVVAGPELPDDRLFVIAEGEAEATVSGPGGRPLRIAQLKPHTLLGEIDPLTPNSQREATVTATTPLRLLSIDGPSLLRVLDRHPEARQAFAVAGEDRLEEGFLAPASHFSKLDRVRLRTLATRLTPRIVAAGETVVREGEPGDHCYLVRSGRLELRRTQPDGGQRRLSSLGPSALFGEEAVLAQGPHEATAVAVEDSELLVLHREHLLEAMTAQPLVAAGILELLNLRSRPRQARGVEAHHRTADDGTTFTVLKDPVRGAYYRLSPQGWFVWQRLDGHRTPRDLSLDYLDEYKAFAPGFVADLLGGLTAAGFVEGIRLRGGVAEQIHQLSPAARVVGRAKSILEWRRNLPGTAALVEGMHRYAARPLFTRPGQAALALLGVAGFVSFALGWDRFADAHGLSGASALAFWVTAFLVSLTVHESGHALTSASYGRRAFFGVGWYWLAPILYVNTSEMWLAERRQRIAVSAAGPYATFLLSGVGAVAALAVGEGTLAATLWQFSLLSYIWFLGNFDVLLEYDGYYVLSDLLDRPNLRPQALSWLGRELVPALRQSGLAGVRGHWLDVAYGAAAVLYVPLAAAMMLLVHRIVLKDWLDAVLPGSIASGVGWVFALTLGGLMLLALTGELRRPRAGTVATAPV